MRLHFSKCLLFFKFGQNVGKRVAVLFLYTIFGGPDGVIRLGFLYEWLPRFEIKIESGRIFSERVTYDALHFKNQDLD